MEIKKLGAIFIIISLIFLIFLITLNSELSKRQITLRCNPTQECKQVENFLSLTHIGFGLFGFMFALGIYLIFFSKSEEKLLRKLEEENVNKVKEEKIKIISKVLSGDEARVLKAIKEQEGITQNTLRLRTDMSKAKLSFILKGLEEKGLIKRIQKGKTLAIYLKI